MPGTSSALEPEWSLLCAACSEHISTDRHDKIRTLLRPSIRWKLLFDLADRHGVQPLLCQALLSVQESVPPDQTKALQRDFKANLHKALLLSRELIRLVDCLSANGIEVMPYKGLALAELVYGDIALRQAGDIDLMIRAADLPQVREVVRGLGYTPHAALSEAEEREYLKSGYEFAFDGTAGSNLLEVQWGIQPRFYAVDFDMAALFQRALTAKIAGYPVRTPRYEDLFVVLALHAAKHVWGRLIWLCDLARIMNRQQLDWKEVGSQAAELGIVRILRVTSILAHRLLGAPVPTAAETHLPADSDASRLADAIQKCIADEEAYDVESIAYFRLMLRLREKRADRLRFVSRLVFTPGPGEWATVRLPRPLFPLYRLVRISRIAARLVKTQAEAYKTSSH
jgi:hypothetical protein